MQDPRLSTVHMLRSFRQRENVNPVGEQPGGLPMRIMPTQLSLEAYGCPIISFAQQFFIDFQTGTTADNIYGVNGLEHRISAGEFRTNIKFLPQDSWGRYESLIGRLNAAKRHLREVVDSGEET
jgi:hypothetical protein